MFPLISAVVLCDFALSVCVIDGFLDQNVSGVVTRYFPGSVYIATAQMNVVRTSEVWNFDWTQALGAIGGIYGLLKGIVITLQGEAKDPDGLLRRYFYAPKPTSAAAASASPVVAAAAASVATPAADEGLRERGHKSPAADAGGGGGAVAAS
jgi:hypothetical protein